MELSRFEHRTRLSHSQLWQAQRQFFNNKGIRAWDGHVPFYITSNPFIAHSYAEMIVRYWQDQLALQNYSETEPFYILELGTGTGQFSFYCLQKLCELHRAYRLTLKFCYVMTDFTEANLAFWDKHPQLQPYLDEGILDFALFDGERSQTLSLINQQITLEDNDIVNPLVVIGNYFFDSLLQDAFCVKDKDLHEALLTLSTPPSHLTEGQLTTLAQIETQFEYEPISTPHYYDQPILNTLLANYAKKLINGHFLLPIGGFTALNTLQTLSNGQLLVLATDKGYTDLSEIEGRGFPAIVCHGSLSVTVNFHAIGEYVKAQGGDAFFPSVRDAIRSCAFSMGVTFKELPRTQQGARALFDGFSPGDYFHIHRHFRETKTIPIHTLLSHLTLSHWDPYLFSVFIENLLREVPTLSPPLKQGFIQNLAEYMLPQIFLLPGSADHYFNAGRMLQRLERYGLAIECYQRSMNQQGEYFNAHFNQGLCWHALHHPETALQHFQRAKALEKDTQHAQEWIKKLSV